MTANRSEKKPFWQNAGALIAVLVVGVIAKGIGGELGRKSLDKFSAPSAASTKASLEEGVAKAAAQIREQAPVKVDQDTTLTGAIAAGSEIIYAMTVDMTLDAAELADANAQMHQTLEGKVCGDKKTRAFIGLGAKMTYVYTLSDGQTFQTSVDHCS